MVAVWAADALAHADSDTAQPVATVQLGEDPGLAVDALINMLRTQPVATVVYSEALPPSVLDECQRRSDPHSEWLSLSHAFASYGGPSAWSTSILVEVTDHYSVVSTPTGTHLRHSLAAELWRSFPTQAAASVLDVVRGDGVTVGEDCEIIVVSQLPGEVLRELSQQVAAVGAVCFPLTPATAAAALAEGTRHRAPLAHPEPEPLRRPGTVPAGTGVIPRRGTVTDATAPDLDDDADVVPLRERFAPSRSILAAVAAAVAVAVIVVGISVLPPPGPPQLARDEAALTPVPTPTSFSPPPPPTPTTTTSSSPPPLAFSSVAAAGLRLDLPTGWAVDETTATATQAFIYEPEDAANPTDMRIVLSRESAGGVSWEALADDIGAQVRNSSTFHEFIPDYHLGAGEQPPVIYYEEHPEGGAVVRWHVVLIEGDRVSLGCQYRSEFGSAHAEICSRAVTTVSAS